MNQERSTSHSPKTRPPLSSSSSNYFTSTSHQPSPSSSMASFTTARVESRHHTHTHTHTAPHNTSLSLSRFTTPASTPTHPTHTPQCPPLRPSSTFYPQKQKQSDIPGAKGVRARKLEFEFELTPSPTGGASSPPEYGNTTPLRPPIKLGTWEEEEEYKPHLPNENRLGSHVNVKVPRKA